MRRSILGLSTFLSAVALAVSLAACGGGGGGGGGGASTATGQVGTTPGGSIGGGPVATAGLRAGAAALDVTPITGTPLGGFGGSPRREFNIVTIPLTLLAIGGTCVDPDPSDPVTLFLPSQGIHDPIMARALVLEKDGTGVAAPASSTTSWRGSRWSNLGARRSRRS